LSDEQREWLGSEGCCKGGEPMGRAAGDTSFEVTLPLLKAWQEADGTLRFEGVASSTAVDRQHERMTPQAIRKMAQ